MQNCMCESKEWLIVDSLCPMMARERPGRIGTCTHVSGIPQLKPWCLWLCLIDRWQEMYRTRLDVDLPGCHPK